MFLYHNEAQKRGVLAWQDSILKSSTAKNAAQMAIEESLSFEGPPDAMISIAGQTYLYFAGNGYLGLQAEPKILAATCEAVLRYGVGTATSRVAFTSPPVFEVERRIADIWGTERSFYTASGYIANQILLESLEGTFDRIFIDESAHYSLFNAAQRIHGLRCRPIAFRHSNANDLKDKLERNLQLHEKPMVITDGVFSFLGTIAPIKDYIELLTNYDGASLWVDDAHGFGVLGENGCGTLEYCGFDYSMVNRTIQDDTDHWGLGKFSTISTRLFSCFSLSKAVGGCGGAIPGSESFIQRLKDHSSVFSGASAPASPVAAATAKALSLITENAIRLKLRENTALLKNSLRNLGLEVNDSPIPIVILTLGSSGNMRRIQKELAQKGILISYLPRYAGLGSTGALRIAVFATHTSKMIAELVDALKKTL
jgi:7-keto-8-aminopelargonate synthetase-like enzyme